MASKTMIHVQSVFANNADGLGLGGLSQAASSSVANVLRDQNLMPLFQGGALDEDEGEATDAIRVIFGFDSSGSMEVVQDLVREFFNDILIAGLREVLDQVGGLRINGVRFDSGVTPLWQNGWQSITGNPPQLDDQNYKCQGLTALCDAAVAILASATLEIDNVMKLTGTPPETFVVMFSDGARTAGRVTYDDVKVLVKARSSELFHTIFIGFETDEPVDAEDIAKKMGFRSYISSKMAPGESKADMRKRLRHLFGVFSQHLSKRLSGIKAPSPVDPGTASVAAGGLWD